MQKRRFVQADVFSEVPGRGNGLAVIVEADGMSEAEMQAFAAWTNLAETTFLMPPTDPLADYRVRIFTPAREMPFAGHPTLGSCAAWLHVGNRPRAAGRVVQECGVGLVEIDISDEVPAFVAPPTRIEPMKPEDLARIVSALKIDEAHIVGSVRLENGPAWQVLELKNAEAVLAVEAARVTWPEFVGVSLIGAHPTASDFDYEVRMISPSSGMSEDPITGSLNAALAHWLRASGRLSEPLLMRQGTAVGRLGRIRISPEGDHIKIGGAVTIVIDGHVTF